MSGCAKRNADRELARVLELLDQRRDEIREAIKAADGFGVTPEEGMLNALPAFRLDLERVAAARARCPARAVAPCRIRRIGPTVPGDLARHRLLCGVHFSGV